MPQLPSGKHFAINDNDLRQLLAELQGGFRVHEVMAIENPMHVLRYVNVLYFKPTRETVGQDNHENSDETPDGWQAYQSGFTVETIRDELEKWPAEDQEAFVEFLLGTRCQDYLQALLQNVEKIKSALLTDGPHVARVQALWWEAGVHPLQPGNQDETI